MDTSDAVNVKLAEAAGRLPTHDVDGILYPVIHEDQDIGGLRWGRYFAGQKRARKLIPPYIDDESADEFFRLKLGIEPCPELRRRFEAAGEKLVAALNREPKLNVTY